MTIENQIVADRHASINKVLAEANAEGWKAITFQKVLSESGYYYVLMEREVPTENTVPR